MALHLRSTLLAIAAISVATWAPAANAHGLEQLTAYAIWPAIAIGTAGGIFGALRNIERSRGLFSAVTILAILAVVITLLRTSAPIGLADGGFLVLLALFFVMVLGFIPLGLCYVFAEWVTNRVVQRQGKTPHERMNGREHR